MKLSIVSTLYKSSQHIHEFCERVERVAQHIAPDDYEIILVNDGSPDDSLEKAICFTQVNPRVTVIDLSRNFGHHKAMMTGLQHTKGAFVFLIDSDLEEEPEWLLSFSSQLNEAKCDVVYGVQTGRQGSFFERITGGLFYKVFRMLTRLNLPSNIVVARLMTRRYVNALLRHEERELFMAGLWMITGFEQQSQQVKKLNISETTYTLRHKLALMVNSITAFSNLPLVSIFYIGLTIMLFSGFYTGYLIIDHLFFQKVLNGWTSVMASIWLLGGAIISFIGIVGLYLSKMFTEIKQRPYTIIRDIYKHNIPVESTIDNVYASVASKPNRNKEKI